MEIKYFPSRNCTTVFRIAEESLGIPSLLDPVDMAECESPDRLSILTYLSEFYHTFKTEKSPPVSKKKEDVSTEDKLSSSDLKRKDSCDSGVSVSPLGSVCNSPPPSKKEPAGGGGGGGGGGGVSPVSEPPPPPSLVRSEVLAPVSLPEPRPSPDPGLDNLLRQRLNISLSSPQSRLSLTPLSCEKDRRSLLSSMISVSGSDISRTRLGQETSRVPDCQPDSPDRRRSLDPSFLAERSPAQSRPVQSSEKVSQAGSKFVSCTRISLSPSNPVKYAWNNSVTCDVKTGPPRPRPWRESNPCKNSAISVPLGGGRSVSTGTLQVKVNSGQAGGTSHNDSFKSKMMKFERMISAGDDIGLSGSEERRRGNLTCNQENNRFPSAVKDVRRKSISFPPSFTVSLGNSEDSKLTF